MIPLLVLDNLPLPVLALEDIEEMVLLVLISMNAKKELTDVIDLLLVLTPLDHILALVMITGPEMVSLALLFVIILNGLNVKDSVMVSERNTEELTLLL